MAYYLRGGNFTKYQRGKKKGGNFTRYQRGKKGGKFKIQDLNPVKLVKSGTKKVRKAGTNVVKNGIEKAATKVIKSQMNKQGKRIGMSKKAKDKMTKALAFTLREQLDKRIK